MKKVFLTLFLAALVATPLSAVTTLSTGHVDIFEVHYDATVNPIEFALHIHDHATEGHFKPADVVIQVAENTLFAPPSGLVSVLGAEAYILPASQEEGMLYGGVSAEGPLGVFQNNRFTIRMVSAGSNNPGNFVLYRFSGSGALQVGLQSVGGVASNSSFTVPINGHEHWNWGFSAPGTYTFEFQALATKTADLSILETPVELFTFQVIPEPSSGALLLAGMVVLAAVRRRSLLAMDDGLQEGAGSESAALIFYWRKVKGGRGNKPSSAILSRGLGLDDKSARMGPCNLFGTPCD